MNASPSLGIVMDPIGSIKPYKDSSFAMLLEAQRRGYALHYFELGDLYASDGITHGLARPLEVRDERENWFSLGPASPLALDDLDVILMRKDPPFDMEYIYASYLLDPVAQSGTLIVNHPRALREFNEKMAISRFARFCAPTLIDRDMGRLRAFLDTHRDIVIKPLDGMGGASVFRIREGDSNAAVIFETLTAHGQRFAMAQGFIPEIRDGDKRILMIDGQPWPQALARIPAQGEGRGNLAAGGRGEGRDLSERDREICAALSPALRESGLLFVGLDVIGDYLTEINVTSPTCIRELDAIYGSNIAGALFDAIEARLS